MRRSEDGQFEIWWDRYVETTVKLDHNRPDVILLNRRDKECLIVEFSVPWDANVVIREEDKIQRYLPLAKDIRKVHGVSTKIIPIILGSLGTVSEELKADLDVLGMKKILGALQTSVLIGTHNILRKVLNTERKEKRKAKEK